MNQSEICEMLGYADTILYNGKILTVDEVFSIVEAVAVRDRRVLAIGSNEEIKVLAGPKTKLIDLEGNTVIPGMTDTHNHIDDAGIALLGPTFAGCRTIADVVKVVEKAIERAEPGKWIVVSGGFGITPAMFASVLEEKRYPTRWDLDPISPNNPVCLPAGHVIMLNSYALRLVGIKNDKLMYACMHEIVKDPKTGEPTGVITGNTSAAIRKILPPATYDSHLRGLEEACERYSSAGLTSIVNHGISPIALRALQKVRSEGKLTVRYYGFLWFDSTVSMEDLEKQMEEIAAYASHPGMGDDMLKICGIKIVLDGSAGSGTAFQRFKYVGAAGVESYGDQRIPADKFKEISRLAAKYRLRLAVHATGGGAIDLVLDTWEEVNKETPIDELRWVLIHCQFPTERNMEQIKKLNLVVSTQTVFMAAMGQGYIMFYPREIGENANPLRNWLDRGVKITLGSDAPVNSYEPLFGIWHACTRKSESGKFLGQKQRISVKEALMCYTSHSPYMTFEEDVKGSIQPTKLADLVVLDTDILECSATHTKDIKVKMTILGGTIVFQA